MSVHCGSHVWSQLLVTIHESPKQNATGAIYCAGLLDPSCAVRIPSVDCCRLNPPPKAKLPCELVYETRDRRVDPPAEQALAGMNHSDHTCEQSSAEMGVASATTGP